MTRTPPRPLPAGRPKACLAVAAALAGAGLFAGPATAQTFDFAGGVPALAHRALSSWGYVAVPNSAAPFLSVSTFDNNGDEFATGQIGGGITPFDAVPIYLEGYAGYQKYEPSLTLSDGITTINVNGKWTATAVTGGVGWDFKLSEHWSLRPIANVAFGQVESEIAAAPVVPAAKSGADLAFVASGSMDTYGYGGSLLLVYKLREASREYDFSIRHTHLRIENSGTLAAADASADAVATTIWGRARYPISSWRAFGNPVRSVWQAGVTSLSGDQGNALGIDWVASLGAGIELDVKDTGVPLVERARLMASYSFGENFDVVSVGLGISF